MEAIQVLIVEDDARISEIHRRFTEKIDGFEVAGIANTIAEAEDLIEVLTPDLILLDIYFPDGNGIELLWKIRSRYRDTDIMLITAAKEVEPLQEAIRGGVIDYILKPVIFSRFQDTLVKYRTSRSQLTAITSLEQRDVDQLLRPRPPETKEQANLPKGIDPITLQKVRKAFDHTPEKGLSAEEVGERVGASRSTSRRYLEYLVGTGTLRADLVYGTVGRPERRYFPS